MMALEREHVTTSMRDVVDLYLAAYRTGDTSGLDSIISPAFVDHSFPSFSGGPAGVRRSIKALHQSFSEITITIDDCVHNADTVAIRVSTTARHSGSFGGTRPTGKRVSWTACDFVRVRDGMITELWSVQDTIALLRGIGALSAGG
jgi:predicted ester cyclase